MRFEALAELQGGHESCFMQSPLGECCGISVGFLQHGQGFVERTPSRRAALEDSRSSFHS